MDQEFSFDDRPFETRPEWGGELFAEEAERGRQRFSRPRLGAGYRPRLPVGGGRRPYPPKGRPRSGGLAPWHPWAVVPEPFPVESAGSADPVGSERTRWLQDCLNQALGTQLVVTGVMGPETRSAVRSFQRQQGLRVSGIAGPDTEEALKGACGGNSPAQGGELEFDVSGLTATLTWLPNNRAPRLYAWEDIQAMSTTDPVAAARGVYIVVQFERRKVKALGRKGAWRDSEIKVVRRILKVGVARRDSFRDRLNAKEHREIRKKYSDPSNRREVGYYLAKVTAADACPVGGCGETIEHLIARTLFRAGVLKIETGIHEKPYKLTRILDKVRVENILPRPLQHHLERAYETTGKDTAGQRVTPVRRLEGVGAFGLGLPAGSKWELEETSMHTSNCTCPKCQKAGELEWGEAEWPDFGEVFGEMDLESPFSEAEEIELAMELLSISSEEELDQFLGKLFKGIGRGLKKVGSFIGKRVLPVLGKGLKSLAKVALPIAGKVLGSFIPIPGVGTAIGGALGTAVSKALELEFGGLDAEEAEFEMARRFVRIAATAARQAASAPPGVDEEIVVNEALVSAVRKHLPSLHLSESERFGMVGATQGGRWIRRGPQIVVLGA